MISVPVFLCVHILVLIVALYNYCVATYVCMYIVLCLYVCAFFGPLLHGRMAFSQMQELTINSNHDIEHTCDCFIRLVYSFDHCTYVVLLEPLQNDSFLCVKTTLTDNVSRSKL